MKIHFIGINGVSMRALADFMRLRGHEVTGSDMSNGGHSAKNVCGCDLVVYTNAVPPDNVEIQAAKRLDIPVIERATFLGEYSRKFKKVVAIAGCHGKSTAAAMTGEALYPLFPTVHVGVCGASHGGSDSVFVTEACEYRRSFLHLSPSIGVILNIGYDHPDSYRDMNELIGAYKLFAENCDRILINGEDPACKTVRGITFGLSPSDYYSARNIKSDCGYRTFDFYVNGAKKAHVKPNAAGAHNVMNALAALSVCDMLGVPAHIAASRLELFGGLPRRFERLGIACGKTVFTDYAHHPDEIRATIALAREMFPSVAVVFQPHTYSRTAALLDEFAAALSAADAVILMPVFAAREKPSDGVDSDALYKKLDRLGANAYLAKTAEEIEGLCKPMTQKAVLFLGAGDIDRTARDFCKFGF